MQSWSWRDLRRGCLIGLIAGVGYVLAYRIILFIALDTPYYEPLASLGWLIAVPVPAFLLWHFSHLAQRIDEEKALEQKQRDERERQAEQDTGADHPEAEE